jgi:hypothetical protein
LLEFFALTESGWINRRADRVIGESEAKSLKAKESADARWSKDVCERNANASKTHGERNASHKPLAISHKPLKKEQEKATIVADPLLGVNETIARDFRKLRSTQKAPITETAIAGIRNGHGAGSRRTGSTVTLRRHGRGATCDRPHTSAIG